MTISDQTKVWISNLWNHGSRLQLRNNFNRDFEQQGIANSSKSTAVDAIYALDEDVLLLFVAPILAGF